MIELLEDHSGLAEWITALISVLAFVGVVVEYRRQKKRERLQVAQEMIEKFSTDDMLMFATTTLDWGARLFLCPNFGVMSLMPQLSPGISTTSEMRCGPI